jgi:hypothetical protein
MEELGKKSSQDIRGHSSRLILLAFSMQTLKKSMGSLQALSGQQLIWQMRPMNLAEEKQHSVVYSLQKVSESQTCFLLGYGMSQKLCVSFVTSGCLRGLTIKQSMLNTVEMTSNDARTTLKKH